MGRAFTFADDYWDAAQCLPDGQRQDFVWAIVAYAFTGREPSGDSPIFPMFLLIRGRVDSSVKQRNRENMGGRPRKDAGEAGEHEKEKEKEKEKEYVPVKPTVKTPGFHLEGRQDSPPTFPDCGEGGEDQSNRCPRCGDYLSGPHGSRRCFAAGCGYVEGEEDQAV